MTNLIIGAIILSQAAITYASLHLLYWVNVGLLPNEVYFSPKSLCYDALVIVPTASLLIWLSRILWMRGHLWVWMKQAAGFVILASLLGLLVVAVRDRSSAIADPLRKGKGPNLLLIVVDSVRPDHLGLYGYRLPTSPALDAYKNKSRIYGSAYAASSWTVPSVAAILGGTAAGSDKGLVGRLIAQGYLAACFTDNPHLTRRADFLKDFDHIERSVGSWRRSFRGTVVKDIIERLDPGDDRHLVDRALTWAHQTQNPFFLYVHLMDSHTPYRHPAIDGKKRSGRRVEFPSVGMTMTPDEAEDMIARYDGGIRSADVQVGRLLKAAETWGRPFVAVVTADHGESMGESGRWFHGSSLAPELLAIPLVVLGKDVVPARVNAPVGHAAIMPTFLMAAGSSGNERDEIDLRTNERDQIVEGGLSSDLFYRIVNGFKLVSDRKKGTQQLFNLKADPEERHELAQDSPEWAQMSAEPLTPQRSSAADRERLRALGYVQ